MKENDYLFTDERNLLLAKEPSAEGEPFEYIFFHNDKKERIKIVYCFNSSKTFSLISELEKLPSSCVLRNCIENIYDKALIADKKEVFTTTIDGKTWKKIHIIGFIFGNMINSLADFRSGIINQKK